MLDNFQKLMRLQVQEDLNNPESLMKKPVPKGGWIKLIRQSLGMTTHQLAKLLNCSRPNISAMERREKMKTISLESLELAAKAMHCRLVYCLIPEKPLENLREEQARLIAKKRLQAIGHSMELEQQGLTPTQKKLLEQSLIQELLWEKPKKLWED